MKTKHTPGPWKWVGTKSNPKSRSYLRGGESGFESVGCCLNDFTENEANAVLIAAAPELLELLDEIIQSGLQQHTQHQGIALLARLGIN